MSDDQHPFGNPDGDHHEQHDPGAHPISAPVQLLTVADVLAAARLVERTASICLRADLTAEHDQVLAELATLVTPSGEVIGGDEEASAGEQSAAGRATELAERLAAIKREMRSSMWHVRFRAMDADAWGTFKKKHLPARKDADFGPFHVKIIAACAIEPAISEDEVLALSKKFNHSQFVTLANTAYEACTEGGLDVPKSGSSWPRLQQQ